MNHFENKAAWAMQKDEQDELASFRQRFHIPLHHGQETVYFCGNSLGLQPKQTSHYVLQELQEY